MQFKNRNKTFIFLTIILVFMTSGFTGAEDKIIALKFKQPPVSDSDLSRTLQSLVKVQGTGQFCQDGLYLMTHFGDREDLFQKEHQKAIDHPWKYDSWRFCSVFSAATEDRVIMGRNWDNQNVGSIIVSLYHPPGGYTSISFSRSIDLGFGHKNLKGFISGGFGNNFLLAPFYAMDGINEHGLTVAVAGVRQTTHKIKPSKQLVFVTFLVRKILDQTKNIKEAVKLVEQFIPFDLDKNSLNTHFLVSDSSGRSIILEYAQDQWKKIYTHKPWQVLTNKPVYKVPETELRDKCWRYKSISEILEKTKGQVDWKTGMKIMQNVTQKGTTWSIVYSPTSKEIYFSVYQKWDTIYHIKEKP